MNYPNTLHLDEKISISHQDDPILHALLSSCDAISTERKSALKNPPGSVPEIPFRKQDKRLYLPFQH